MYMNTGRNQSTAIRQYKDNVFCLLYRDKNNLLDLYNGLNDTDYTNVDDLTVTTLKGGVYMKYKNDASFVFGQDLYMFEQQSSRNPNMFSPHPLFENFGERVERSEACVRLGLDPANRYVLFFGLIRDYKGLDLLLDAWAQLRRAGRTEGRRLIVAGEFYTAREPYLNRIADNGLQDEVLLHDRFIPDDDVKYYFSAADFVVQPYKTATQSGVTQIAYQFCVPMVVTKVGGLAEIVQIGRASCRERV